MNRNSLTTAVVAGIAGVVGIANMANAVNLNPDGLGQVLLYPYYTTNAHQQTLISVVNTTSIGKAVKVRFLEGHNSREVLDFNLFLSPFDVWTSAVFALSDAGVGSSGAGILTNDNSCTAPALTESTMASGQGYVAFRTFYFTGANTDSGPTSASRTQEGHFEMISMGDINSATVIPGSTPPTTYSSVLLSDITHVNGVPPGCKTAESDFEAGGFAAITAPTSGLFGSGSVVNVASGTYYSYNADAIAGFTNVPLGNKTGSLFPSLGNVNDAGFPATVTSYVFNGNAVLTSAYPGAASETAIDAVSSIFAAANVYNEWQSASDGSAGSDWVVTFPTKRFYVDPAYVGFTASGAPNPAIAPFKELFGGLVFKAGAYSYTDPDNSCVGVGATIFNREEGSFTAQGCTFSPCPPGQPGSAICKETNIISFLANGTNPDILGSSLRLNLTPFGANGWASLAFSGAAPFRPAANGNVFSGLPVTGFEAVNFAKGNNVGGVLQFYSGVYRHRLNRVCAKAGGAACS